MFLSRWSELNCTSCYNSPCHFYRMLNEQSMLGNRWGFDVMETVDRHHQGSKISGAKLELLANKSHKSKLKEILPPLPTVYSRKGLKHTWAILQSHLRSGLTCKPCPRKHLHERHRGTLNIDRKLMETVDGSLTHWIVSSVGCNRYSGNWNWGLKFFKY